MMSGLRTESAVFGAETGLGIDDGAAFDAVAETFFPQPMGTGEDKTQVCAFRAQNRQGFPFGNGLVGFGLFQKGTVITSYSIHYTKLYDNHGKNYPE